MTLYRTILIDPPWHETGGGKIPRGADHHYPVVKDRDILPLIRSAPCFTPAPDCHLWLWTTNNRLPLALSIIQSLGFRYLTNLCWVKDRFGIGQYLRGQHELCLLATRGKTHLPPIRNIPSILHAPRTSHSSKPLACYPIFQRISAPPYLEMFARHSQPGWDHWGNHVLQEPSPQDTPQITFSTGDKKA